MEDREPSAGIHGEHVAIAAGQHDRQLRPALAYEAAQLAAERSAKKRAPSRRTCQRSSLAQPSARAAASLFACPPAAWSSGVNSKSALSPP